MASRGRCTAKGYRQGKLKFELHGHKLRGRWMLVRMKGKGEKQDPWLLIKEKDQFAQPAAEFSVVDEMPGSVAALDDKPTESAASPESPEKTPGQRHARPPCPKNYGLNWQRWRMPRRKTPANGFMKSNSTAIGYWPAYKKTKSGCLPARAMTGPTNWPTWPKTWRR